ncbi:hypothetical protein BKA63DRAFT_494526 [Paraphoma chrysanthemicola]|nr:hypothetical protein BKA63DRAFT_494526 [Paraphoma chrysanthemicola]
MDIQSVITPHTTPHTSAPTFTNILATSDSHQQRHPPHATTGHHNTGVHRQRPLPEFVPPSRPYTTPSSSTAAANAPARSATFPGTHHTGYSHNLAPVVTGHHAFQIQGRDLLTHPPGADTPHQPTNPSVPNAHVAPARKRVKEAPDSRKPAPDLKGRNGRPAARTLPQKGHQALPDPAYHPPVPLQWYCCQCESGPNSARYCTLPSGNKRRPVCRHEYCIKCMLTNGPWPISKRA